MNGLVPYDKYKDSGVEWLGRIPEEWIIKKVKFFGTLKGGAGFPHEEQGVNDEELPFHKVNALGTSSGDYIIQSQNTISKEVANSLGAFVFPKNTIVFAKVGAALLLGRIRRTTSECCIDNNMMGLIADESIASIDFMHWEMGLIDFAKIVNPGAVPSLNEGQIGNYPFAFPPLSVQYSIAFYLDHQTQRINTLVKEQQELIELLQEKRQALISHSVTRGLDPNAKMKDSGVEWLGEIPETWTVWRIASLFFEVNEDGCDDLPILSVSIHDGVSDKEMNEEELDRKVTRSEDRSTYKRVTRNDLVYNMMRAWQGAFGTVQLDGMVSPAYVVARPKSRIRTDFVEQSLRTPNAIENLRIHSRGITDFRLRLYWDEFRNIKLAVPSVEEQAAIMEHCLRESERIDLLVSEAKSTITLMQEHRSALISAVVTGKVRVSD